MNASQIFLQPPNLKNDSFFFFWGGGGEWRPRPTDVIRKAQNGSSGPLLTLHGFSHIMPQRLNEM